MADGGDGQQSKELVRAILAGSAFIALAIYFGGEPRFTITQSQYSAYILDRITGSAQFCVMGQCSPVEPMRAPVAAPPVAGQEPFLSIEKLPKSAIPPKE